MQVKKHDVRQMMVDIDKLEAATVTFDDFVEMVTPRITGRDTREEIMKVRSIPSGHSSDFHFPFMLRRLIRRLRDNISCSVIL